MGRYLKRGIYGEPTRQEKRRKDGKGNVGLREELLTGITRGGRGKKRVRGGGVEEGGAGNERPLVKYR